MWPCFSDIDHPCEHPWSSLPWCSVFLSSCLNFRLSDVTSLWGLCMATVASHHSSWWFLIFTWLRGWWRHWQNIHKSIRTCTSLTFLFGSLSELLKANHIGLVQEVYILWPSPFSAVCYKLCCWITRSTHCVFTKSPKVGLYVHISWKEGIEA